MRTIHVYNEGRPYDTGHLVGFYTKDNKAYCTIYYTQTMTRENIPYDKLYFNTDYNCMMYKAEDAIKIS